MTRKADLQIYRSLLTGILAKEHGRYAVIADGLLLGVFDRCSEAIAEGHEKRGLRPMLVKKVVAELASVLAPYPGHLRTA